MYRFTIKDSAYSFNKETKKYETVSTEHRYNCETIQQLVGLLEYMIATSETELDCTIARVEEENDG